MKTIDGYRGRYVAGTVIVGPDGIARTIRGETAFQLRYTPKEPVYVGVPKAGSTAGELTDTSN